MQILDDATKKNNNSMVKLYTHHFQALILARIQRRTPDTSSPIINSQAEKLINSYMVIWTVISLLVLLITVVPC